MTKIILITGSTDGIGLETAKLLAAAGHTILLHGRSSSKLEAAAETVRGVTGAGIVEAYKADLSRLSEVEELAKAVAAKHETLDVLINNAGVYNAAEPRTADGLDIRFAVNTIAPYLLMQRLLSSLGKGGRVVNLSSAAQAPVDLSALVGKRPLADGAAYAQSKLALTAWTRGVADRFKETGPVVVAVNPGSLLGSKMVRDAFGIAGGDLRIGADILGRAALSDEFGTASGQYFDNDSGGFAAPHPDGLDSTKIESIVSAIDEIISK